MTIFELKKNVFSSWTNQAERIHICQQFDSTSNLMSSFCCIELKTEKIWDGNRFEFLFRYFRSSQISSSFNVHAICVDGLGLRLRCCSCVCAIFTMLWMFREFCIWTELLSCMQLLSAMCDVFGVAIDEFNMRLVNCRSCWLRLVWLWLTRRRSLRVMVGLGSFESRFMSNACFSFSMARLFSSYSCLRLSLISLRFSWYSCNAVLCSISYWHSISDFFIWYQSFIIRKWSSYKFSISLSFCL